MTRAINVNDQNKDFNVPGPEYTEQAPWLLSTMAYCWTPLHVMSLTFQTNWIILHINPSTKQHNRSTHKIAHCRMCWLGLLCHTVYIPTQILVSTSICSIQFVTYSLRPVANQWCHQRSEGTEKAHDTHHAHHSCEAAYAHDAHDPQICVGSPAVTTRKIHHHLCPRGNDDKQI